MGRKYIRNKTKFAGIYYYNTMTNNKPDKTFYIRYKDENNKDKELKIGKFSEGIREAYCNAKRNEIITKIRLGEDLPKVAIKKNKTSLTLNDLAIKYFEHREVHHNEGSKKNEEYRYNSHIKPKFGNNFINSISIQDVEKLQREKLKTLAPKTVNHITTLLGTIYNYAINNEIYNGSNPTVKVKKLKVNNKRERFLNQKEIQILLNEVKNNKLLYFFCLLSFSTGGRLKTILNIEKKHINTSTRIINLKDFKNDTWYNGFLTQGIVDILLPILETIHVNDKVLQIQNKPISNSQIQKRLKPILDKLFNQGLEKDDTKNRVVIHTFRHSFASNLAIKGTPIYTIQKLLNHKDINMTLRYAKLAPDSGRDMVDLIMHDII